MNDKDNPQLADLRVRLAEVNDLEMAASVLEWDQETYMPSGGGPARGRQLATLERLAHEKFSDPAVGHLLDALQPYAESLPNDHDDAALIRVTRRAYDRAVKVPPSFTAEAVAHLSASYNAWTEARPANNFDDMKPYLEKTLDLSRRYADLFPGYDHPADPLIDRQDEGMRVRTLRSLFGELRSRLTPLMEEICSRQPVDDSCLHRYYPEPQQWTFGEAVIRGYGYDFERGRQDKTHHPFMTKFSLGDVRITTRFDEHNLGDGLFSTLHESGHAMYELGINPTFEGTPLAEGTSAGVHESQSRLWENLVGRSREFWQCYYPRLQAVFPTTLSDVSEDEFYRALNKVQRSLIRVDADEVTYNLHVIIRFELELQLLEGSLAVADLPKAWRALYEETMGISSPDDKDGVLQDVHWYSGFIGGMFQGYTLGNIMSAQFYQAALQAHPEIPAEIAAGRFDMLHGWLSQHLYRHGAKFTANELLERTTGGPLEIKPYLAYLTSKYGKLYELDT
jgi:carboxypeptidase Taq